MVARNAVTAQVCLVILLLAVGALGCSQAHPTGPTEVAVTTPASLSSPPETAAVPVSSNGPIETLAVPDVSGIWNGTSTLSDVSGGDCAAALIRGGITAFRRRMTVSQAGSSLTIALSANGSGIADETWSGTIDTTGRITATWRPTGDGNSIDYICDPRSDSRTRRVVRRSATASLSYLPGSAALEGTITSRSDVASIFGQRFPELVHTTAERFTKQ